MIMMHYQTNAGEASLANLVHYGLLAHGIRGLLLSFQMVVFSFVGIEMIGMTAAETKNPRKEIPKCINDVPVRILLFYVGSLLALMCIYPWTHFSASASPFVQVFADVGIKSAAAIINFVVLTAALSSCNSGIFTTGRMAFSLCDSSDSKWGRMMNRLSKHQVPFNAIAFSTAVIAISVGLSLIISNQVFLLISSVATTCFLYIWGMIVLAHLKYRRLINRRHLTSQLTFKMPVYPLSDYFVLVFLGFVAVILLLRLQTLIALVGSLIWLFGMYLVRIIHRKSKINS